MVPSRQDGSTASDNFVASAMGPDGSVVLAGVTTGTWSDSFVGGTFDFAAVKLDSNGDEVWRWQVCVGGMDPLSDVKSPWVSSAPACLRIEFEKTVPDSTGAVGAW